MFIHIKRIETRLKDFH